MMKRSLIFLLCFFQVSSWASCPQEVNLAPTFKNIGPYDQGRSGSCYAIAGSEMINWWLRNEKGSHRNISYQEMALLAADKGTHESCKNLTGQVYGPPADTSQKDWGTQSVASRWWQCEQALRVLSGGLPHYAVQVATATRMCEENHFSRWFMSDGRDRLIGAVDALMSAYHDTFMREPDLNSKVWPESLAKALRVMQSGTPEEQLMAGTLVGKSDTPYFEMRTAAMMVEKCMKNGKIDESCRSEFQRAFKDKAVKAQMEHAIRIFNQHRWESAVSAVSACEKKHYDSIDGHLVPKGTIKKLLDVVVKLDYQQISKEIMPKMDCPEDKKISLEGFKMKSADLTLERIDKSLCRPKKPRPVSVTVCSGRWTSTDPHPACGAHEVVLIGRRIKNKKVEYLIRNSWGPTCADYRSDWVQEGRCNTMAGDLWIKAEDLLYSDGANLSMVSLDD